MREVLDLHPITVEVTRGRQNRQKRFLKEQHGFETLLRRARKSDIDSPVSKRLFLLQGSQLQKFEFHVWKPIFVLPEEVGNIRIVRCTAEPNREAAALTSTRSLCRGYCSVR